MDLSLRTETFGAENQQWLASAHGTDSTDTITLDGALMGAVFADGQIPSGVVLGKVTATGLYGPYSAAAVDGRADAKGLLYTSVKIREAVDAAGTFRNAGAALLWHGEVDESKLPTNHGLDAGAKGDLTQIRFV